MRAHMTPQAFLLQQYQQQQQQQQQQNSYSYQQQLQQQASSNTRSTPLLPSLPQLKKGGQVQTANHSALLLNPNPHANQSMASRLQNWAELANLQLMPVPATIQPISLGGGANYTASQLNTTSPPFHTQLHSNSQQQPQAALRNNNPLPRPHLTKQYSGGLPSSQLVRSTSNEQLQVQAQQLATANANTRQKHGTFKHKHSYPMVVDNSVELNPVHLSRSRSDQAKPLKSASNNTFNNVNSSNNNSLGLSINANKVSSPITNSKASNEQTNTKKKKNKKPSLQVFTPADIASLQQQHEGDNNATPSTRRSASPSVTHEHHSHSVVSSTNNQTLSRSTDKNPSSPSRSVTASPKSRFSPHLSPHATNSTNPTNKASKTSPSTMTLPAQQSPGFIGLSPTSSTQPHDVGSAIWGQYNATSTNSTSNSNYNPTGILRSATFSSVSSNNNTASTSVNNSLSINSNKSQLVPLNHKPQIHNKALTNEDRTYFRSLTSIGSNNTSTGNSSNAVSAASSNTQSRVNSAGREKERKATNESKGRSGSRSRSNSKNKKKKKEKKHSDSKLGALAAAIASVTNTANSIDSNSVMSHTRNYSDSLNSNSSQKDLRASPSKSMLNNEHNDENNDTNNSTHVNNTNNEETNKTTKEASNVQARLLSAAVAAINSPAIVVSPVAVTSSIAVSNYTANKKEPFVNASPQSAKAVPVAVELVMLNEDHDELQIEGLEVEEVNTETGELESQQSLKRSKSSSKSHNYRPPDDPIVFKENFDSSSSDDEGLATRKRNRKAKQEKQMHNKTQESNESNSSEENQATKDSDAATEHNWGLGNKWEYHVTAEQVHAKLSPRANSTPKVSTASKSNFASTQPIIASPNSDIKSIDIENNSPRTAKPVLQNEETVVNTNNAVPSTPSKSKSSKSNSNKSKSVKNSPALPNSKRVIGSGTNETVATDTITTAINTTNSTSNKGTSMKNAPSAVAAAMARRQSKLRAGHPWRGSAVAAAINNIPNNNSVSGLITTVHSNAAPAAPALDLSIGFVSSTAKYHSPLISPPGQSKTASIQSATGNPNLPFVVTSFQMALRQRPNAAANNTNNQLGSPTAGNSNLLMPATKYQLGRKPGIASRGARAIIQADLKKKQKLKDKQEKAKGKEETMSKDTEADPRTMKKLSSTAVEHVIQTENVDVDTIEIDAVDYNSNAIMRYEMADPALALADEAVEAEEVSAFNLLKDPNAQAYTQQAQVLSFLHDLSTASEEMVASLPLPPLEVHKLIEDEEQETTDEEQEEENKQQQQTQANEQKADNSSNASAESTAASPSNFMEISKKKKKKKAYEPSEEAILSYAEVLGIELPADADLLWIAKLALQNPLPHPWKACEANGNVYFVNFETKECSFTDPSDEYYYSMYEAEKVKKWKNQLGELLQHNKALKEEGQLDLSNKSIDDVAAECLCELLLNEYNPSKGYKLHAIDFSHNRMSDVGVESIIYALENSYQMHVRSFNMSHNHLSTEAAYSFARYLLQNSNIRELELSNNDGIGNIGLEALADSIATCHNLTSLKLAYTSINDFGLNYLSDALRGHSSLVVLDLSGNQITDAGLNNLGSSIMTMPRVTEVYYTNNDNNISQNLQQELQYVLEMHRSEAGERSKLQLAFCGGLINNKANNSGCNITKAFSVACVAANNNPNEPKKLKAREEKKVKGLIMLNALEREGIKEIFSFL